MSPPMIQNMSKPRRTSREMRREVGASAVDTGRISRLDAETGAMISLLLTFVAAKVEAYEFVFAAGVEKAVGESRMSADLSGENLGPVEWLE